MTMTEAIAYKIIKFCNNENISINEFSLRCGLTRSTVNNIVNHQSKNIKIKTIIYLCHGMNISIQEFYQDNIFDKISITLNN